MESMRSTHKLQFPPMEDDNQEIYEQQDSKRHRAYDKEDEVEKFFALVDRIRAMNEILRRKRPTFDPAEVTATATKKQERKDMTSKPPWKPSFEWEDFSYRDMSFGFNSESSNSNGLAINRGNASKEMEKLAIGSDEGGKVSLSDKCIPVGSFDLNSEAPLEHPVSSAL